MLLEVRGVVKFFRYGLFGFRFRAVDNVSLSMVDKPLILTLAGESGSGKTTLARMILGIYTPDSGEILYRGRDINRLGNNEIKWFRKEVQAVFQDPYASFNPYRRVYTYFRSTAEYLLGLKGSDIDLYIDEILQHVGLRLSDIRDKYPHEFSGGELQRLSIARALLTKPRLIVADEPVSMLDASLRVNIVNMFKEFKEKLGVSFIYVTHDLSTAYYISDLIAIMYRGAIVEQGPVERVLSEPLHPYTQTLLSSIPKPDPHAREVYLSEIRLSSEAEEKEFILKGCKYASRCPFAMEICWKERPPEFIVGQGRGVACWLYKSGKY
ncbi:MAG: ABC transporter ATP-binding protein [Sulfolobales archaeon]